MGKLPESGQTSRPGHPHLRLYPAPRSSLLVPFPLDSAARHCYLVVGESPIGGLMSTRAAFRPLAVIPVLISFLSAAAQDTTALQPISEVQGNSIICTDRSQLGMATGLRILRQAHTESLSESK